MREEGFAGYDIVPGVARLAAMILYLHGLGGNGDTPIIRADSLLTDPGRWRREVPAGPAVPRDR